MDEQVIPRKLLIGFSALEPRTERGSPEGEAKR
jgi:hypothetical protein